MMLDSSVQRKEGATSCLVCAAGSFAPYLRSTACTRCSAGAATLQHGGNSCINQISECGNQDQYIHPFIPLCVNIFMHMYANLYLCVCERERERARVSMVAISLTSNMNEQIQRRHSQVHHCLPMLRALQ